MMRFLPGVKQPKPYPLGIIGPADMDPEHLPFVIRVIDKLTWRLPNLEILVHGFKERLSHSTMGGVEAVAALYAKRYWYTLKVYRQFAHTEAGPGGVLRDMKFFEEAKGFIVFDDGSKTVRVHKRLADWNGKKVKVYEIN